MRSPELERTRADLILTELDVVKMFMRISRTSPDENTRERNRRHALKAFMLARASSAELRASPKVRRSVEEKLAEVKKELKDAGEFVE